MDLNSKLGMHTARDSSVAENKSESQSEPFSSLEQPSSLLQSSSYSSRFEKDLTLGLQIRDQVSAGIPKGSLRAISQMWLSKYFHYVT